MVTNPAGEIAMAYYQPAQTYVAGTRVPSGNAYVFVPQRAVSLAWVAPGDADALLAMRGDCCGGNRLQLFKYATEGQVSIWQTGTRGPDGDGSCGC